MKFIEDVLIFLENKVGSRVVVIGIFEM